LQAKQVLGIAADDFFKEIVAAGDDMDAPNIAAFFKQAQFKEYIVTLKCKMEMVRDEQRLKVSAVKLRALEGDVLVKENKALLAAIKQYQAA
jgi:hypothetical protein